MILLYGNLGTMRTFKWLSKNIPDTLPQPTEAEPSLRKVNLLPAKLGMLSPLTSGLDLIPSHRPWTEAYYPKF